MTFPYDLVILDRDGVINVDHAQSVKTPQMFSLLPRVGSAIATLNGENVPVVIATNQAVVGRGDLSIPGLQAIHDHMAGLLLADGAHIDHIFYCTDVDILPNNRRKPAPGMLMEAMARYGSRPGRAVMIGDDVRDFDAAAAVGCDFYLVRTGKGRTTEDILKKRLPFPGFKGIFDDLTGVVETILHTKLIQERHRS